MLHTVLFILKMIGTILLAVLAIIVILLFIVLYSPLKYFVEAKMRPKVIQSDSDCKKHDINISVKFSWFFHLISGHIRYAGEALEWQISLFGKKIDAKFLEDRQSANASNEITEELNKSEDIDKNKANNNSSNNGNNNGNNNDSNNRNNDNIEISAESNVESNIDIEKNIKDTTIEDNEKYNTKTKEKITDKIKNIWQTICMKIKVLNEKKEIVERFINNEIHKSAFGKLKKELFYILRKLKPKKFYLTLHFGFEDPSLTGKFLGTLCILYPIFKDNIDIHPEFQKEILEGETLIKGKLRCSYLIGLGLRLLLSKDVRRTVRDLSAEIKTVLN